MFHQSQTQAKLSIFRKEECSLIHYSLGWAAGMVRSSDNQGIDGVGPTARYLWGTAAKLHARFLCSQVLSPEKISNSCALLRCQKHRSFYCFLRCSHCCQCDKQPEVQCELYFHTLLYEKITKGN